MSQSANEDDPEVQRNGFAVIQETADIPDNAMEDYYDDFFDPNATWDENLESFFEFFEKIQDTIEGVDEDDLREQFGEDDSE